MSDATPITEDLDSSLVPAADDVADADDDGIDADTADAVEADAVPVVVLDLESTDGIALAVAREDDARIEETDLPAALEIVGKIRNRGVVFAKAGKTMLGLRRELAQLAVQLMPLVHLPSGKPDWDGTTAGFKVLFDKNLDAILESETRTSRISLDKSERRKLINSVRQHVKRTYLDPAIRLWVWETNEAVKASMPNGQRLDPADGIVKFVDSDTPLFHDAIKAEYRRSQLAVPNRYLSSEEVAGKRTGGGSQGDPDDPAAALRAARAGAEQVAIDYLASEVLALASVLAVRVTDAKSGAAFRREATANHAARFGMIGQYVAQYLDKDATERKGIDDADMRDVLWTEDDAEAIA